MAGYIGSPGRFLRERYKRRPCKTLVTYGTGGEITPGTG